MKAKKVDHIINAALASRRLEPSPELWEQLEHQLLKPATPFKKQRYFRYAALLILLFGLSSVFYFWEANLSIAVKPATTVVQETAPEPQPPSPEIIFEETQNTVAYRSPLQPLFYKEAQTIQKLPLPSPISRLRSHHIPRIATVFIGAPPISEDSLLSLEADELIQIAMEQIKQQQGAIALRQQKALELLVAIEEELLSETYLKNRIITLIKNGYSKVKVSMEDDNSSQPPK